MADDSNQGQTSTQQKVIVPPEVQAKHGDIVALIFGSESMNDEERQYWINILPVMTPDQVQNLREILENEKRQLKEIDNKYSKEIQQINQTQFLEQATEERRKKSEQRKQAEQTAQSSEEAQAEDLLKQIESQGNKS